MLENQPQSLEEKPRFSLKKELGSPIKIKVATTLPNAKDINSLWDLPAYLGNDISACLNQIYSHITLREPAVGRENFFHHVAGTALYESYHQTFINDKNHGKKAGTIFHKVNNTIKNIEHAFDHPDELSTTQITILKKFHAGFLAHKDALIIALKNLSPETQAHLLQHQNINVENLQQLPLSPQKKALVKALHPQSPIASPRKMPQLQLTPKKLTPEARQSQRALQATEPPSKHSLAELELLAMAKSKTVEVVSTPSVSVAKIPSSLIPVRFRRQPSKVITQAPKKAENEAETETLQEAAPSFCVQFDKMRTARRALDLSSVEPLEEKNKEEEKENDSSTELPQEKISSLTYS